VEGYIAEMEQMKRSQAPSPPPLPPPAPTPPALVDPPTVVAERSRDDEAGPFYTRFWFWTVVAGAAVAGIASVWLLSRDSGATHGNLGALDLRDKGR